MRVGNVSSSPNIGRPANNQFSMSHSASILHWHYLNKTSIHEFDIQLRNQSGKLFDFDEINKFNLVLVFETVEVDEISADFIKQYNDEGYRIAHTRDRIQYKM